MAGELHAVLFDFDMTLVDSSYSITECTNLMAQAMGLPLVTREQLLQVIGLPIEESWVSLFGSFEQEWLDYYRAQFRALEQDGFRRFPGTEEIPRLLQAKGIKTAVVSNRRYARKAVEKCGLADLFDAVIGLEDVTQAKPHPESVLLALQQLNVTTATAVFVGDTDIDMKTAVAAGVRSVGVTTGAFSGQELLAAGATWSCDDLRKIPQLLGVAEDA